MINKIMNFIKEKLIIIIGFFFGILAISIGISIIIDSNEYSNELNFGNYKFNEGTNIQAESGDLLINDDIKQIIKDNSKNSLITYTSGLYRIEGTCNSDSNMILPVAYNNVRWLPNIIYGRHLTDEETISDEKLAVIGIDMFNQLGLTQLDETSKIVINDTEFKIIGVMGRKNRFIDDNRTIFIPYSNFMKPDKYNDFIPLSIYSDKEDPKKTIEAFKSLNGIEVVPNEKMEKQISDIDISYKLVILVGVLILILTSINMSTTCMFWVHKRKKEFAIRKSIGATDKMIAKLILKEISEVALIGCLLAFLFQIFFTKVLENFTINMELNFGLGNLIVGLILVIILSISAALVPIKKSMDINISEEIKS